MSSTVRLASLLVLTLLAPVVARADGLKPLSVKAEANKATPVTQLAAAQSVEISATGEWSVDNRNLYGKFGPAGTTSGKPTEPCALVPSAPMGALVGSLDGQRWFAIGAGPTTVNGPGSLQVAANDCTGGPNWPFFQDNSGSLTVRASLFVMADAKKATTVKSLADKERVLLSATGTWAVDNRNLYGTFGPAGTTTGKPTESCALVPTAKMGALIGSLDGKSWFEIGPGPKMISGPGVLQLAANDCTGGDDWRFFADHSGTLKGKIEPGP